jgi:hypothetical protein
MRSAKSNPATITIVGTDALVSGGRTTTTVDVAGIVTNAGTTATTAAINQSINIPTFFS